MKVRNTILVILLGAALPVSAQTTDSTPSSSGESRVAFMPRAVFHMSAEHLSSQSERLVWDANFGGEIDLLDYGVGRATFVANYQVVLGEQLQKFDPNQGNYILSGSASTRVPGAEIAAVFYHQSRHMSDRVKEFPVDWNMAGVRVARTSTLGVMHLDSQVDVRGVVQKTFVDYRWEVDGGVRGDVVLRPRLGLLTAGGLRVLGVDGSAGRGTQTGFRLEGGVRLEGDVGAVELFVAGERRIDPYPLEFGTDQWISAGFRLLSR